MARHGCDSLGCEWESGHEHPCGRRVQAGVTTCEFCGHLDGSDECHCWMPVSEVLAEVWERSGLRLGGEDEMKRELVDAQNRLRIAAVVYANVFEFLPENSLRLAEVAHDLDDAAVYYADVAKRGAK